MPEELSSVIADNRLGLGRRGDAPMPADAVPARLTAQFDRYQARPAALAAVPSRAEAAASLITLRNVVAANRVPSAGGMAGDPMDGGDGTGGDTTRADRPAAGRRPRANRNRADAMDSAADPQRDEMGLPRDYRRAVREQYVAGVGARFGLAVASEAPFVERLVHFWANHFAVSIDKLSVIGFAGLMEFEAVRPHVLGRFGDMLWAVETHPAMLLYLDQAQSIGPDSVLARAVANRRRGNGRTLGLNENLAREILELHTLGVDGGYSQDDVTELARALTGITMPGLAPPPLRRLLGDVDPGEVRFVDAVHQPGSRTLLGRRYEAGSGDIQPRSMIGALAAHPATARHLSFKLARHFVADDPPAALVNRLTAAFVRHNGDLRQWYGVLLSSPETWAAAPAKVKTPWEWAVSAARALGWNHMPPSIGVAALFRELGQPVWQPGSPAGFDDVAASWLAPDALLRRIEAAQRLVRLAPAGTDPRSLATHLFGPLLSDATATAIARAESTAQALALLLVSPEFLRR